MAEPVEARREGEIRPLGWGKSPKKLLLLIINEITPAPKGAHLLSNSINFPIGGRACDLMIDRLILI